MTVLSRGFRALPRIEPICPRCLSFSTTSAPSSGHNRWSKIKHDKGAKDANKSTQRGESLRHITLASKQYGPDPKDNPRLAALLVNAKKSGMPKALMQAAIARGQGKSETGALLENMTFEFLIPPSISMIIEAETEHKKRMQMEVGKIAKEHGAVLSPIAYLFQRRGRVTFELDERNLGVDDVFDEAIEAGAEDIELDKNGGIVVWTEPNKTIAAATTLQKSLGLKVESSDIVWSANNDTKVQIKSEEDTKDLLAFIDALQEHPDVLDIYTNVAQGNLSNEAWEDLKDRLDMQSVE